MNLKAQAYGLVDSNGFRSVEVWVNGKSVGKLTVPECDADEVDDIINRASGNSRRIAVIHEWSGIVLIATGVLLAFRGLGLLL